MEDGYLPRTADVIAKHSAHLGIDSYRDLRERNLELDLRILTVAYENAEVMVQPQRHFTTVMAVGEVREQIILWLEKPIVLSFRKAQFGFDARLTCAMVLCMKDNMLPIFESSDAESGVRIAQLQFGVKVF